MRLGLFWPIFTVHKLFSYFAFLLFKNVVKRKYAQIKQNTLETPLNDDSQ